MLDSTGPAANTRGALHARDAASASLAHPSPHDPVASTSTAVNPPAHLTFHRQLQEDALAKLRKLSGELEEVEALLEDCWEEQFELRESLNEQDELAAEVVRERQQHRADVNAFSAHYGQKQAEMKTLALALPLTLDGEGEVLERIVYPHQTIVSKEGTGIRLALFLSPEQQAALPVTLSELKGHGILEALPAGIAISQADLDSVKSDFNSLVKEADKLGDSCRRLAESWQTAVTQQELILEDSPRMKRVLVIDACQHERLNPDRESIELAIRPHEPQTSEELRIEVDDCIQVLQRIDDDWDIGYNLTAHEKRPTELPVGFFPRNAPWNATARAIPSALETPNGARHGRASSFPISTKGHHATALSSASPHAASRTRYGSTAAASSCEQTTRSRDARTSRRMRRIVCGRWLRAWRVSRRGLQESWPGWRRKCRRRRYGGRRLSSGWTT